MYLITYLRGVFAHWFRWRDDQDGECVNLRLGWECSLIPRIVQDHEENNTIVGQTPTRADFSLNPHSPRHPTLLASGYEVS
jgi:hypothetical protein